MTDLNPNFVFAEGRLAGAMCRHCSAEIRFGDSVAVCPRCGGINHESCWRQHGGCGSYECAPARRVLAGNEEPTLRISADDLAAAPLPPPRIGVPFSSGAVAYSAFESEPPRRSRLAVAAAITAILGIPIFGIVTGLVAVVLGSIALGTIHQTRAKGLGFALTGVFLGIADVVGWIVFLAIMFGTHSSSNLSLGDFDPDPAAMENLPPTINRALRSNVLVETKVGFGRSGIGSGVILRIANGEAIIVTNRHVVDPDFSATSPARASVAPEGRQLQVKLMNQMPMPGQVLWLAPDGIDLALVKAPVQSDGAKFAKWDAKLRSAVGDEVFSIGNPQHLDWSTARGVISQFRIQTCGEQKVRIIQTDTAINPGNSGGGLYDKKGCLIGINTWTNDKRFSEGISFAITIDTLWKLDPPPLKAIAEAEKGEKR